MKIYVASSWRNPNYEKVVAKLREKGHIVNDWRDPAEGPMLAPWEKYLRFYNYNGLPNDIVQPEDFSNMMYSNKEVRAVFEKDVRLMKDADVCVLLTPCGRSAHLELGYMAGQGKKTVVLLMPGFEPELMYGLAGKLVTTVTELCWWISWLEERERWPITRFVRMVSSGIKYFFIIKKQQWKS